MAKQPCRAKIKKTNQIDRKGMRQNVKGEIKQTEKTNRIIMEEKRTKKKGGGENKERK